MRQKPCFLSVVFPDWGIDLDEGKLIKTETFASVNRVLAWASIRTVFSSLAHHSSDPIHLNLINLKTATKHPNATAGNMSSQGLQYFHWKDNSSLLFKEAMTFDGHDGRMYTDTR